jgi:hypothetical protein
VGAPGLEPGTSALSGPRSDHLSYAPGPGGAPKTKQNPSDTGAPDRATRRPRWVAALHAGASAAARAGLTPHTLAAGARPPRLHIPPSTIGRSPHEAGTLPRKEVIQPQLPLRLPCYDFVPITSPTLDGCPPEGLAHRLQVLPAFVT